MNLTRFLPLSADISVCIGGIEILLVTFGLENRYSSISSHIALELCNFGANNNTTWKQWGEDRRLIPLWNKSHLEQDLLPMIKKGKKITYTHLTWTEKDRKLYEDF